MNVEIKIKGMKCMNVEMLLLTTQNISSVHQKHDVLLHSSLTVAVRTFESILPAIKLNCKSSIKGNRQVLMGLKPFYTYQSPLSS